MTRLEYEQWMYDNGLNVIHTLFDDYEYSNSCSDFAPFHYGVYSDGNRWYTGFRSIDDRGPNYYEKQSFSSESEAFDALKLVATKYLTSTIAYNLRDKILSFYKDIYLKQISFPHISCTEATCDYSFAEYEKLISRSFPGEFDFTLNKTSLTLYSRRYHSFIFEIFNISDTSHDTFRPVLLKFDNRLFINNTELNRNYCDFNLSEDGIYILYWLGDTALEKYNYQGNLLFTTKWDFRFDMEPKKDALRFIDSNNCPLWNNGSSGNKYIAISNGLYFAVFNKSTGKLKKSNFGRLRLSLLRGSTLFESTIKRLLSNP